MPLLLHHSDSAAFIQLIEFFIIGMAYIVKKTIPLLLVIQLNSGSLDVFNYHWATFVLR